MSNKFYVTIRRIYNTSPKPDNYKDKLYLSKSSDYSNLEEIDLEGNSITNYIVMMCRDIHWSKFQMFVHSQPFALIIKQGELVVSPELVDYLHRHAWQDLFKGCVPPPNGFISSEPAPDLLKDL